MSIQVVSSVADAATRLEAGDFLVATHGGDACHSDELAGTALLALAHAGRDLTVFRIERDDDAGMRWAKAHCAYVYDVGGPTREGAAVVLDHHFIGLQAPKAAQAKARAMGLEPEKMSGRDYQPVVDALGLAGVPYSSAGLILKRMVERLLLPDDKDVRAVVSSIDALDNGLKVKHGIPGVPEGIAMLVHQAAPVPLEGGAIGIDRAAAHFRRLADAFVALFQDLMGSGPKVFQAVVDELTAEAEAGRQASRERVTPLVEASGEILVLDQYEASALDVLGDLAETSRVLYLVFPSGPQWMVQQAPARAMPCFEGKKPLPKAWAGLRDQKLADATGVPDAVFCHPGQFIGGASSREGAIALGRLAVEA